MLEKVKETIKNFNMISKGDMIVVGFSGGPDSLALLHVLISIQKEYDLDIHGAHINHMIRGEEALRDERFSREFCENNNIRFHLKTEDVNKLAKKLGLSSEEAGRKVRYEFFQEIINGNKSGKIALAHNLNDNSETIIMRVLRGTSLLGMGGISPTRDNIIRPIINCTRNEIEAYCDYNNLNPVIDSTNLQEIYTRNKIRLKIIPYIRENFNPNILENLHSNSKIARDEDEFMMSITRDTTRKLQHDGGYNLEEFNKLHIAMKRRVIRCIIEDVLGNLNGIESKHIDMIIKLIAKGESGKRIDIKNGLVCGINYNKFNIINKKNNMRDSEESYSLPCASIVVNGYTIDSCIIPISEVNLDEKNTWYFDTDKIKGKVILRCRQNGDYMYLKGLRGKKKLKDIFIDMKLLRDIRDVVPLVTVDSEVLVIPGIKESTSYNIDNKTTKVLKITIKGE
ncbi:MAG: tRNA lysidine(34) synthetase TilS [Clostridium sp.]